MKNQFLLVFFQREPGADPVIKFCFFHLPDNGIFFMELFQHFLCRCGNHLPEIHMDIPVRSDGDGPLFSLQLQQKCLCPFFRKIQTYGKL